MGRNGRPEADPLFYSGYGTGYGLRSVGYHPAGIGYSGLGYTGLGHAGSYIRPAYTGYTGYTGVHAYGGVASTYSGLASPFVRSVYNPVKTYGSVVAPVSTYGSVVAPVSTYRSSVIPAYTGYTGYHHLGKREAEAEPYTVYGHPAYTGYTGYTGYNRGYSGYNMGYSAGYPLRSIHTGYTNLWG